MRWDTQKVKEKKVCKESVLNFYFFVVVVLESEKWTKEEEGEKHVESLCSWKWWCGKKLCDDKIFKKWIQRGNFISRNVVSTFYYVKVLTE